MTAVLSVVSELFPLVKTGGLGDVTAALPPALRALGVDVTTLIPGYPGVVAALDGAQEVRRDDDLFGGPARLFSSRAGELDLLVIDAPHLYARPGNPYVGPDGRSWPDNAFRFGALGWMASRIGLGDVAALKPDIVHCHDWQAALTMAYLAYDGRPRARTVFTVHNLAYQGQFAPELLSALRLPPRAYAIDGVEYYGSIGFLKSGLQFADCITTVSPTYAAEIQTPENGCGIDPLLRMRAGVLSGILNGIDTEVWNPASDPRIPARYDASSITARRTNKQALQERFGLTLGPERLLFGAVTRFAWQKGMDLVSAAVPTLREVDAQLVVLGTGEHELEQRFTALVQANRSAVGCKIGYDEDLAHLIQAGCDALLVPSRFEPCGLTQLCALRYGAVPVVAKVGGLADTIVDLDAGTGKATGLQFSPVTQEALEGAIRRTADLWRRPEDWAQVQRNGMATDVSWAESARKYLQLYRNLLAAND
jgi:starch synthase